MKQLIFIILAIIGVSQAQTIQYIGAPTTTVISRGNFRTDSIFYLPKRTKLPTDTAALRYQISDSSLYAWTGSQWRKVGADADTLIYSTRAWRQKGDDSLAARINLKVNISDTASMLTPYLRKVDTTAMLSPYYRSATASAALALKLNISDTSSMLGNYIRHAGYGLTKSGQSFLVDTLNIATRAWRQKGLDSLAALEVSGSGTTNRIAKFTATSTIGNSLLSDDGVELKYTGADGATVQGTTSAFLSLYGTGDNYIQFKDAAGTAGRIQYNHTSDYMSFNTASTERLRIFSNGRVFIGASPTDAGYQLDVNGTFRTTGSTDLASSGGEVRIAMADAGAYTLQVGGPVYFANAANTSLTTSAGLNYMAKGDNTYFTGFNFQGVAASDMFFGRTASSDDLVISTSNTGSPAERVRFKQNGDVGIGTNSPAYKLDVNGTLRSVNGANFATTSGNVGIGTASPAAKADITGTLRIGAASFVAPTSGAGMEFSYRTSDSTGYLTTYSRDYSGYRNQAFYALSQKFAYGTGGAIGLFLTSSGETLINTESDAGDYKLQVSGNIYTTGNIQMTGSAAIRNTVSQFIDYGTGGSGDLYIRGGSGFANVMTATNAGEVLINTTTDAGDYKLQVVGNARVGTGKLDIASNTVYGLGVARSGTSEVAGQIYNSNGILYFGAESSTGGGIFSGSSAYAGVIGTGANYPLQFAVNNTTFATLNTNGRLLINTTFDNGAYPLQIAGSVYNTGQVTRGPINTIGTSAQLSTDSTTNLPAISINQSLTGASAQPLLTGAVTWNTTGEPNAINVTVTNTASGTNANFLRITDGSNIFRVTKDAEVVTAAPTGGSIRKWKLGEAATVSPTSPNRTIRVEIDGTVYYLHAKTTND